MNNRSVYGKIKALQRRLDTNIKKHGLSDEKTIELSKEVDEYISYYHKMTKERDYPKNSEMFLYYRISYDKLKEFAKENGKFPNSEEWNKYAKENNLLSSESIKYISTLDWTYLRVKVNREINMKII